MVEKEQPEKLTPPIHLTTSKTPLKHQKDTIRKCGVMLTALFALGVILTTRKGILEGRFVATQEVAFKQPAEIPQLVPPSLPTSVNQLEILGHSEVGAPFPINQVHLDLLKFSENNCSSQVFNKVLPRVLEKLEKSYRKTNGIRAVKGTNWEDYAVISGKTLETISLARQIHRSKELDKKTDQLLDVVEKKLGRQISDTEEESVVKKENRLVKEERLHHATITLLKEASEQTKKRVPRPSWLPPNQTTFVL